MRCIFSGLYFGSFLDTYDKNVLNVSKRYSLLHLLAAVLWVSGLFFPPGPKVASQPLDIKKVLGTNVVI